MPDSWSYIEARRREVGGDPDAQATLDALWDLHHRVSATQQVLMSLLEAISATCAKAFPKE